MLDYRYQTFITLCQEKSYTKTAEILFITQPAVSQHVKWLETKHQGKLVHYQNREITLTDKGQTLFDYLLPLSAQIKKVETVMSSQEGIRKQLRFAATLSISEELLPKIIMTLNKNYPQNNFTCFVENTQRILSKLRTGDIDFALVEGNFPSSEFSSYELSLQPFIAVVRGDSPLVETRSYTLKELINQTLITRENGSGSRKILDTLLAEQNVTTDDFSSVIEIGSPAVIKKIVQEGLGFAFLYEAIVKEELAQKKLKKLTIKGIAAQHGFYFIFLKESLFEADFVEILSILKEINDF